MTSAEPSRRRGVAMIETVLTLPLIFVLLALILYGGVSMLRWHRVASIDRYEVWRAAAYAPGPSATPTRETLGEGFFAGYDGDRVEAADVAALGLRNLAVSSRRGTNAGSNEDLALTYLLNTVGSPLFEQMFRDEVSPLPTLRQVTVGATFFDRFGQDFAGRIDSTSRRLDGDWRYVADALDMQAETYFDQGTGQITTPLYSDDADDRRPRRIVSVAGGVRRTTFERLDAQLDEAPSNPLAEQLRELSRRVPAYVGPKIPIRAERLDRDTWDFLWRDADGRG
jgi:hypothetical protein